ncbi:CDCA3 protein, partial [Psilopogon haemacephalus]|nr:CDCA3 protein [Psilopogon haemacephalus]
MGVSGSAPATPAALRNKHLAHVSDPRSPSAGIPRTPIEVGGFPPAIAIPRPRFLRLLSPQVVSSPTGSPQPGSAEPAASTSQDWDPRSPTPGIFRTPMRVTWSDSVDHLVKQLGETFGAEATAQEPVPPDAACPAEEPVQRSSLPAGGPGAATVVSEEKVETLPSPTFFFLSLGSKPMKRKTTTKVMAAAGGAGRSPLSILQDDNSPSAPAPRQGKRHVLGENLGEKEVTVDPSRTLKSGNYAWSDLNKENQQCPFVEN